MHLAQIILYYAYRKIVQSGILFTSNSQDVKYFLSYLSHFATWGVAVTYLHYNLTIVNSLLFNY